MDEPTSAWIRLEGGKFLDLIKSLKQTATVFMSTHNLNEVEKVCDMVGIINRGKLVTISSVESLQKKYARIIIRNGIYLKSRSLSSNSAGGALAHRARNINRNGAQVVIVKPIDVDYARRELPRLISDSGLTLARYELVMPSLEDIFVEILDGEKAK
jgi:ABC-2 type transport system ATP-binding protein